MDKLEQEELDKLLGSVDLDKELSGLFPDVPTANLYAPTDNSKREVRIVTVTPTWNYEVELLCKNCNAPVNKHTLLRECKKTLFTDCPNCGEAKSFKSYST